jgi:hypothetical protein
MTLTDLAAEHHPLPISWVAAIGAQICAVLMAAHEIGLVHRDLKPSNVMVEASGAVKVLDFGLAAIHRDDRYSRITRTGQNLGTPGYMAPEQINAEPTDHRTDLYGLGGTLFHLLTGEAPFDGQTTLTLFRHQITNPPPRASALRPDLPPALDELIDALLAVDPAQRPADALAVYAILSPHAKSRTQIPGVITEQGHSAWAYAAAIAGSAPTADHAADIPGSPAAAPAEADAERLFRAGDVRAAAHLWRQLAEQRERTQGADDTQSFQWRLRAARAHERLGEHDRAVRQLDALLDRRTRAVGPDHPDVRDLRQEIDQLRSRRPGPD